jgi:catechol 2,3-dioxygenase-like lactoylglutathione lyase family enzyme
MTLLAKTKTRTSTNPMPSTTDDFPAARRSKRTSPTIRRFEMSKVASKLNLTRVGRVTVSVADTDRAIDFYVGKLGFEKVVDVPMGPDMRWVEVALPDAETTIAIAPPPPDQEPGGKQTGICLDTSDVDADHATLKEAGVDVDDEVTRFGGAVPPMFWLRDPDGNSLIVVQPSS